MPRYAPECQRVSLLDTTQNIYELLTAKIVILTEIY